MLRNTASAITSTLTKLFNQSLSTGEVPSEWKLSKITPVFKGKVDPCCIANYRPISLLSLPSKVLERIVRNRLLKYLLANNIPSSRQFGFRPGSSTQEALLFATNDWSRCLDKRTSVAAVFFDLSKVLIQSLTVNSSTLLLVLEYLAPFLTGFIVISPTEHRE